MLFSFKNLRTLIRKNKLFLAFCLFSGIAPLLVINLTRARTYLYDELKTPKEATSSASAYDDDSSENEVHALKKVMPDLQNSAAEIEPQKSSDKSTFNNPDLNVWCEAFAYKDLSQDPRITRFNKWLNEFQKFDCILGSIDCTDHDPRYIYRLLDEGEKLAVARKPVFSQILRGNPRQALELAIPQNLLSVLPHRIREHLEQWESGFADIRSMHLCFTKEHPGGYIKTTAQFPDGRNFRTWSFGNRSKLQHKKGLAIWGISLGEDLAISEDPFRITNNADSTGIIELAGSTISFSSETQRDLVIHEIRKAETHYRGRRGAIYQIKYPVALASSMSADSLLRAKYDLNTTKVTFNEALTVAMSKNGNLLQISDETENRLISKWLEDENKNSNLFPGFDESNNSVNYVWLGATDNESTKGLVYNEETNSTTQELEINAVEGDWKWLNGEEFSFENWAWDTSSNETKDFAALDWNDTNGSWVDINETARLPFIIEYDLDIAKIETDLKGIRKVLVVPARFVDETVYYKSHFGGSNVLLTNEFDEEVMEQIKADPYEPATRATIQKAMDEVAEFYNRNTDGELKIIPVISPVVTLPHMGGQVRRYMSLADGSAGSNAYDSDGNYTRLEQMVIQELPFDPDKPSIEALAMSEAASAGEDWDYEGFAFVGLSSIDIIGNSIDTNFSEPPSVALVGGEVTTASGVPHPRFEPASVEVNLDSNGDVIGAIIVEPGEYYGSAPNILLDGIDYSDHFEIVVEHLLISKVALTNYSAGAPGLGWVGAPGAHVQITDGQLSSGIIAHEIGHNFGLWHANRFVSRSESVLSDDSDIIEYGNPYSVMGGDKDIVNGGDLTALEKVAMNNFFDGGGGYTIGSGLGADVVDLRDSTAITNSIFNEFNRSASNLFRIYRSDYKAPPRFLRESDFSVVLPQLEYDYLDKLNLAPFEVRFVGTGEEANGSLSLVTNGNANALLQITNGGRGFVEEPTVEVVGENDEVILTLNPSWIRIANGSDFDQQAQLVSFSEVNRWIRGARIKTPANSPVRPLNINADGLYSLPLTDYYVSYRTGVSEDGLVLEVTNNYEENEYGVMESFMLDATPETPLNFQDAHLLLGTTYSDYDADIHITPIRNGGNDPMKYIECVINIGTIGGGEARAPKFDISLSDSNPKPKEFVEISATVTDGNSGQYAYSWYLNEKPLTSPIYLNQPAINYQFSDAGRYVIRLVVSDLKGAVASRNVVVTVEGDELTNRSMVSGTVGSSQGFIQGARVILDRSPVIEHNVSLSGSLYDSFFVDGMNNPAQFVIDGQIAPQLVFRRGEIHRFNFEKSVHGITMSFLEQPENTAPRVHINMLSDPKADSDQGNAYFRNPKITYKFNSAFSNYLTENVATYYEMLNFLSEQNNSVAEFNDGTITSKDLLEFLDSQNFTDFGNSSHLVTRPYARALMQETSIYKGAVGPSIYGEAGYVTYGGRGYSLNNIPIVEVRRASIWEDYNKSEANATAKVDGVNTISPVIAEEFLGNTWETRPEDLIIPDLVVWGSGGGDEDDPLSEVNASVDAWVSSAGSYMRTINILNQGKGFEPNSTMAVLHYPTEPLAYWTFDRHETLFEDKREGRYQPSPAWNREIKVKDGFRYYWTFDDNDSGITDSLGKSLRLESNETLEEEDFDSWGLLGKSLHLADAEINATQFVDSMDQNFTVSFWVWPEGDFDINFSSDVVHASYSNGEFGLQEPTPTSSALIPRFTGHWTHIAFVYNGTNISFYVNGDSQVGSTTGSPTFDSNDPVSMSITSQSGRILLDEFRVFNKSLSETSIRYLAGISFLDISGNKFHATPIGSFLTAPDENMSSSDVPENITAYSFGSGTLGDSFDGEDNGKSLSLSGSEQFLDLENHLGNDFKLSEGTISVWVKQNAQSSSPTAPIFSMVRPYKTVDNNGTNELSESGKIFSLELQRGSPRLAGFSANQSLRDGEWSHLVATFPFVQFWINGQQVDAQVITSGNAQFEEASELTDLANNAKYFRVGYSYDRIALSEQDQLPATPPVAYFHGHLDDLAIYDRILTQQEVTYLYNLWMGKEQIPRLEAVVDAVGTVVINEGGEGYRENPDLDFWYGEIKEKEDLETFPDLETLKSQYNLDPTVDINGTHGQLAYVEEDESVYSLHIAKENNRTYAWRENEGIVEPNGWRKFISAAGLGEFENASLGHVVWAKRMDELVDVAMPDGRFRTQRLVDYVTMDQNNSSSLERNASSTGVHEFYKPNGLYGFVERVDLLVDGPSEYNSDAVDVVDTAHAYVHFYIDNDANESITLVDPGTGVSDIPFDNIKISGPGYQPATDTQKEEEHPGFAEIETDQTMAGTIYAGSGISIYNWSGNEDVNVSRIDFNKTYLSVSVDNPGFGYAMPVDFEVIGGRPTRIDGFFTTPLPEYNSSVEYDFEEAEFEVTSVSADGAIESISITNMGRGYVNYDDLTDEELETLAVVLRAKGYDFSTYPFISITGGGGHGALFKANIDSNGSITSTTKIDGGRGYENVIPNNYPRAVHTPTLSAGEKNASLAVMLGGYLKEIPRCTLCEAGAPEGHDIATTPSPYSHLEPWIEIWDRGRSEEEIDSMGARAHAAPKVVNGEIVKVIVTNSGTGYIDPVVMVRDAPPKHIAYHTTGGNFNRTWKCTYERTLPTGEKLQCGHVHVGHYPPEYCPGETDDTLPYEDENGSLIYATGSDLVAWKARHDDLHKSCTESDAHLSVGFLSRKCWGTKTNYILHDNAIYRNPRADWLELDANLTIISKNGKIREIVVDNPGSNYYATQIHVEGTGSGVDAIPVFNEYGLNTRVIFDDPRIKNLEMDLVPRPHGAGQGFRERPWAGDEIKNAHYKSRISGSPYGTEINNPLVGYDDRVDVIAIHSDDYKSTWNFGQPVMADYLGDRVLQVEVMDPGLYENSTELNVTLDYDASGSLDKNRDGSSDFIAANITGFATTRVTKFVLDDNASYEDNSSDLALERGLFTENPRIQILDGRNFQMGLDKKLSYSTENPFSNIRFNDSISYDPNPDKSYIELYIDDRFPTQLYYGEGITTGDNSMVVPAFGGQILVTEGVPGGSWAIEEPMEKPNFSLSDENGYYAFTNLSYGMYNVSVLLEDQKLQESTFRPVENETRISQFVYLPGFPDLTLVTDNYGKGQSTLLWSRESRNLSRSSSGPLDKVLAGVGRGFDPSKTPPELIIIPDDENFITTRPNIEVSVLVDGSLRIEIVDDENTTQYFPSDKFTIKYSSTVTGIDFLESYLYSESNQTFKSGTLSSWEYNETMTGTSRYQSAPRLVISPDDGDGTNILEAVLSTSAIGEVANVFRAQVFEGNGTEINASNVEWKVSLDFNSSEGEGNNTNIVQLEGPSGTRDLNTTGDQIELYLHSRLREYSGSLHGIEVVQGGKGYRLFEPVVITDSNGYGLEANIEQIVTETFYVSGVQPGPTFYQFTDSNNQDRNFSDIEFIPGHTYKFVADDINTSHPFMIGESIGDMDSSLVSGSSLVGDMGEIIVSFPSNHAGELAYFSEGNHSMTESVDVNVTETFTVSGGGTSEPFFTITDSDGNNNNLSSIKLSAGKTYKFEADDINTSHPFMIGERTGDMDSLIVSGGPITGSNGEIIVAIPDGYQGELFYFCVTHDNTMNMAFDINETDVNTLGEISKVAVSNRGYGYTYPMEIRVSGSGGNGALLEPILPQGHLVLEANFTMTNGQVLSEQVKIKASDRQVLSSQEKWMDLYLDSFLEKNESWWERELSASNSFEDTDDDNLTNFEEWRFGSNPLSIDTDLDDLNDSTEYSFTSSPILADTDSDGLTDYKEWSWPHQNLDERPDPRNPDSDGDGLLDGEDELPKNSDGMGILSGRIIVQKRYSAVKNKLFYRFAEANETSDWNDTSHWLSYDDENWTGGPNFFYEDNLFHDRNYTIQVYIELKDLNESDDANFTLGEPIASETVTLNSNLYGIQLVPVDDPPQLVKNQDFEDILSIDLNETNETAAYDWGLTATDPYTPNDSYDMGSTLSNSVKIILEGNFTEYLIGLPENNYEYNSTMLVDLDLVPPGIYSLTYKALDNFENYSEPVEQKIIVSDTQPPFLTIIDFVNNTGITTERRDSFSDVYPDYNETIFTFLDQNNATADLNWSIGIPFNINDLFVEARDNKSGAVTWELSYDQSLHTNALNSYELNFTTRDDSNNLSTLTLNLNIIDEQVPEVFITGSSIDSNNSLNAYRGKGFYLEDKVQIFADDSFQGYQADLLNFDQNRSSFQVDWDGLSVEIVDNKTFVVPGFDSNYTITFSYSDSSGNMGSASLVLRMEDPPWEISGKAIDGYLKGSLVRFIKNGDGPVAISDEEGNFTLIFSEEELQRFDLDANGIISSDEGTIVVSGGIDVDTNASFLGELRADAESKIVSPITSVLTYMVSQGDLLEEAEARLLEALGLNPDLDLRTYDPYAVIENDLNNSVAADVLLSNLRIANIINIPEAILNIEGGTSYRSGQISQALFIQIAQNLRQTTGPADLQAIVGQVLPSAIDSLALTVIVREEEISAMTEIIGKADPQSLQSNQYSVRETLIGSQMWVKDNIFDKIAEEFSVDIVELDDKLDPISVVDVENIVSEKNLARRSNLYSPSGKDFKTFFSSSTANKDCLWELETFDADGDTIYHSLLAGNFDFDGDGQNALVLEPDGRLCLLDYDDIRRLAGTTLNLEIKLDDLRGGKSSIQGEISIRNLLALESSELDDSWHHSDWFGSFYSVEGSWIYHHPIGWLYVHPDEQGGFWFWDHKWDFWWWSKKQAFPWIYRDDSTQWDYLMVMPDGVNVFDLVNRRWRRRE